jgi:hypothetical protein
MSTIVSTGKNGWEKAIEETKEMLARVEAKARRLRTSLATLQESKDAGDEWPIKSATQN